MFNNQDKSNFPSNQENSHDLQCHNTNSTSVIVPIHIGNSGFSSLFPLVKLLNKSTLINNLIMFINRLIFNTIFAPCLFFLFFINVANAQTTTVTGPSDATSNPPASASDVNQLLKYGGNISLKNGSNSTSADIIYQWYKLDNTGTKRLVQSGSNATLAETASGAGYYTYQLVISNSNQCSSEISDPFKVFVLPELAPTIAASSSSVCSNGTSTVLLTANPGSDKYTYTYQWTLNGNNISGATAATYTTPTNISGSNTFGVNVSYTLSPATTGTATQVINVVPVPAKPAISVGQ